MSGDPRGAWGVATILSGDQSDRLRVHFRKQSDRRRARIHGVVALRLDALTVRTSDRSIPGSCPSIPARSPRDGERPHHVVVLVLDDVTVVDVALRRPDAGRQVEFRTDGCEVAWIDLDRVLEAALARIGRQHWSGGEWPRIDPAWNTVERAVSGFIRFGIERRTTDDLKRDQMH